MNRVDLNCDLGESFGPWQMGDDAALLPLISSVNIACGFHAGDPQIMRRTVALALQNKVAIGAHVSLPDLQGFGRREMRISADEAYAMTLYQIGALHGFVRAAGSRLSHVKPHGALYNMAARDAALAKAIAQAAQDFDPALRLVGLAGSLLIEASQVQGLRVTAEVFADRRYRADGSLQPRSEPDAVIDDIDEACQRAMGMVNNGMVEAIDGSSVKLQVDSICLHGDGAHAVAFARALRLSLESAGWRVVAPNQD